MALVLERRLSKDQILELYLNDVWLGQRGSFAVHGVAEASRLFFAKDISNVSLSEAATSPASSSPRRGTRRSSIPSEPKNAATSCSRRWPTQDSSAPKRPSARRSEPCRSCGARLESRGAVLRRLHQPGTAGDSKARHRCRRRVYDARPPPAAARAGRRARRADPRRRDPARAQAQKAQAALIAVDPRTGEILAMVGGRSYNQSQFNRAISARRQPGSVFKPFVYLAAFEQAFRRAGPTSRRRRSSSTNRRRSCSTSSRGSRTTTRASTDGPVTLRRALAHLPQRRTIKVAETTGYGEIAALWRRSAPVTSPRAYPSIALGVFEATPLEIATAYTLFPNGGTIRPCGRSCESSAAARTCRFVPRRAQDGRAAKTRRFS